MSASIEGVPPAAIPRLWLAKGSYFSLASSSRPRSGSGATGPSSSGPPSSSAPASEAVQGTAKRPWFSRLIYPLPPQKGGGLGIHLTLDMVRLGRGGGAEQAGLARCGCSAVPAASAVSAASAQQRTALDGRPQGGNIRFGPDVEWVETLDYTVAATRAAAFRDAITPYFPRLAAGELPLVPAYAGVRPKLSGPGQPAADFAVHGPGQHAGLVALYGIESPGLTSCLPLARHVREVLLRE